MRGRISALVLTVVFTFPLFAPTVIAEWETDTWISNVIGPERLENGDEFGCHGYEGVDTLEENWVIQACRDYIVGLTNSSKWGKEPISFGIKSNYVDPTTVNQLIRSGFMIVGDSLDTEPQGLISFSRNGGSLEKGVADIGILETADEDSLISIYWRARVGDLRVRDDPDVISWLENQEVWFTTWGEWYLHSIASEATSIQSEGSSLISSSVHYYRDRTLWKVPGTTKLLFDNNVISVQDSIGQELNLISPDSRKLEVGWRPIEGGMILTQPPGTNITIELDGEPAESSSIPMATFNGLHHAVTIVGHQTSNLFRWTQDFSDSELVFTWLIERPIAEPISWIMPIVAISILIAVPASIYYLVNKDRDIISNSLKV